MSLQTLIQDLKQNGQDFEQFDTYEEVDMYLLINTPHSERIQLNVCDNNVELYIESSSKLFEEYSEQTVQNISNIINDLR